MPRSLLHRHVVAPSLLATSLPSKSSLSLFLSGHVLNAVSLLAGGTLARGPSRDPALPRRMTRRPSTRRALLQPTTTTGRWRTTTGQRHPRSSLDEAPPPLLHAAMKTVLRTVARAGRAWRMTRCITLWFTHRTKICSFKITPFFDHKNCNNFMKQIFNYCISAKPILKFIILCIVNINSVIYKEIYIQLPQYNLVGQF